MLKDDYRNHDTTFNLIDIITEVLYWIMFKYDRNMIG